MMIEPKNKQLFPTKKLLLLEFGGNLKNWGRVAKNLITIVLLFLLTRVLLFMVTSKIKITIVEATNLKTYLFILTIEY